MKIQIEDTVYEGTAAGIMEQLRHLSFDPTEFPDVETYIGLYRIMSSAPREWTVRCRMAMRRHRRQPCSVIWTALAL